MAPKETVKTKMNFIISIPIPEMSFNTATALLICTNCAVHLGRVYQEIGTRENHIGVSTLP